WALNFRDMSRAWVLVSSVIADALTAFPFRSEIAFSKSRRRREAASSSKLDWMPVTRSWRAETSSIKLLNCSRREAISCLSALVEGVDAPDADELLDGLCLDVLAVLESSARTNESPPKSQSMTSAAFTERRKVASALFITSGQGASKRTLLPETGWSSSSFQA